MEGHDRNLSRLGVWLVIFSLLASTWATFAQSPVRTVSLPDPSRELSNLEIIKATIAASGGEVWRRPKTLQLTGTATLYWQGLASEARRMTTYKMWRVFPDQNEEAHRANGKVRFDAFAGDQLYFRVAFDSAKSHAQYSQEAERMREYAAWDNAFGFSILRFADGEGFTLIRLADDQVEGHLCYFIRVIDPKKNETIFGIDRQNFYVRSVAFDTPIGFHQRIYSDFKWHENPRFLQPTHVRLYYKGVKTADIHWETFKVNEPISDGVFTP